MVKAQPADTERLPWLEPYRDKGPRPRAAASPERPSGGFRPLTLLLSVLLAAALVGLASFWIGRRTAPPPVPVAAQPRGPSVTIPVAQVEPIPMPDVAQSDGRSVSQGGTDATRPATVRRSTHNATHRRTARRTRPAASRPPPPPPAPPKPRAVAHWAPPLVAGRTGQIIDLGRYLSPRYADAAYRTTVRRHPYLAGLTKVVSPAIQVTGQPRLYRLQLGARSADEAQRMCRNLMRAGRPCTVR